FIEKNATLKARLDLLTNLQFNHKNDERLALIEFHKKFKSWIGLLTESYPLLVDDRDNAEIKNKVHQYDASYVEAMHAQSLLELYTDDEMLIQLIMELTMVVLEHLAPHPKKLLIAMELNNWQLDQLQGLNDAKERKLKSTNLYKERRELHKAYGNNMLSGRQVFKPYESKYIDYARAYMKRITDAEEG
ncbi:MAG: hypothetical protein RIB63_18495, partial [Fulvivirga sp.]